MAPALQPKVRANLMALRITIKLRKNSLATFRIAFLSADKRTVGPPRSNNNH